MADTNTSESTGTNKSTAAWLGCVADDVTGATDLAINLVQGGLRVVQFLTIPTASQLSQVDCDAVVVALKTRSIPANQAVSQSVAAIEALRDHGCQRFFFKYCSTFDSTPEGNIGPVADALLELLDQPSTIVCPAFPRNTRTVYQGHLFVGDRLLNDSGMESHPLNPMVDADIVRYLGQQSTHQIGLVDFQTLTAGPEAIRQQLEILTTGGQRLIVTDACDDAHLQMIAAAVSQMPLLTGGSGIARYLPEAWRNSGDLQSSPVQPTVPNVTGRSLILAGSCSRATRAQVQSMMNQTHSFQVKVDQLMRDRAGFQEAFETWLDSSTGADSKPLMIYSTADDKGVEQVQQEFGREAVCAAVEDFHAQAAVIGVRKLGVRRLVVAGGETSGAVVNALKISRLSIGPEICAGVPWTLSDGDPPLAIALKSGNFGDQNFFQTALEMLP